MNQKCMDCSTIKPLDKVIKNKIEKLYEYSLMETLNDVTLRLVFTKFIESIHETEKETESLIMMRQYVICQKIIKNNLNFDNHVIYRDLLRYCPTIWWHQKIKELKQRGQKDEHFKYVIEKLKWEVVIELICHEDYKAYLMAIKRKSRIFKEILRQIYNLYYF